MMGAILVPGVNHRLLPGKSHALLAPQVIAVHTMVWDLANCEHYFRQSGRPYSHFGTGHDGEVRQWQDLRYRAASDLDGNPYNISIENADTGPGFPRWTGSDVPAFTDDQADALVVLLSWLCHRFGLPKNAITSSCPHERGIGWHRHGVDPYRNTACGRRWSSAYAKACPGDRRIAQLQREIIPAVSAPAPAAPAPPQEDDMAMIVKGDQTPHWWITDGLHKDYIETTDIAAALAFTGLAKWNAGHPFVLAQSIVDSIPQVAKPTTVAEIRAALAGLGPTVDLTDEQVRSLADALPAKVADELGKRLKG